MSEEKFMHRAIKLARKGQSWTNPNPLVGAILVKNNQIIGEGCHAKFGGPHAEANAIKSAGNKAKDSTLYVNLEPCSSYGNTPPCTEAIIKAGIKKVVYASSDSMQKQSTEILKNAGVEVIVGILRKEADFLNRKFLYFTKNKLPYITIKFATSLDGKLATKTFDSKWITNEKARIYARSLRAEHQAVLVGSNTVIKDNPHLGTRQKNRKDPIRIILDTKLKTSVDSAVYRDSNAIVFSGKNAEVSKLRQFQNKKITVYKSGSEKINIKDVLGYLAEQNIISVLVEGGGEVIGSFVDAQAVNEVYGFYAPVIIGGKSARSIAADGVDNIKDALKLNNIEFKKFDDNFLIHGLV